MPNRAFISTVRRSTLAQPDARIGLVAVDEEISVGKYDEVLKRILNGVADASIRFDDLRKLLLQLGFEERVRGSHHIFRKSGIQEKINIQSDGNHAKPYQVRQVRSVILRHKLAGEL